MDTSIVATLLQPAAPNWPDQIGAIHTLLGAPNNPAVFPSHFLRVVLPRIGGHIVQFQRNGQTVGVGFLFPRASSHSSTQFLAHTSVVYTLRCHALQGDLSLEELAEAAQRSLPESRVIPYDPAATHAFRRTSTVVDGWDMGAPSIDEAAAIRSLQKRIWGVSTDNLYPTDIHSTDFGCVQSEVVRSGNQVVAFLFGFYKHGGRPLPAGWDEGINRDWRLESQVLGVHPDLRGRGVATLLKMRQAEKARQAGIDIVNWTADPLLWPNAALNFGRLGAVAFDFVPGMYAFRNEMNRVPASRLALTWLVNSRRVQDHLRAPGGVRDLAGAGAVVVNDGSLQVDLTCAAPRIAIEIPQNWVALQAQSLSEAEAWRSATDTVLAHYIGSQPGNYIITSVARERERCYLVAE